MIPGKIFTSFAEFQGIVCVNDFRIPLGFQKLLQASLGFLGRFCVAWVALQPLSCQVLYHNGVSMIMSRLTSFAKDFVIGSYQIKKIYPLWARLYRCVFCKKPSLIRLQTDIAISVFRKMSKNVVFYSVALLLAAPKVIQERTGSISMFWNTFINQSMLELCSQSGTPCNSPLCNSSSSFFLVFDFF